MLAIASVVIHAPVEKIWNFVLDPKSYPQADTKIRRFEVLERSDREMHSRANAYLRWPWLRSSLILRHKMKPYERIDIEAEPGTPGFPGRLALDGFKAEFLFEKLPEGIRVTHVENYLTKDNALGRLAERLATDWLRRHIEWEMQRLKALVEGREPPPPSKEEEEPEEEL